MSFIRDKELKKRFQNKVATGRLTFSFTVIYAVTVLLISGFLSKEHWIQIILLALSTLLMVALNNKNSLIRGFCRLVSCSFLAFTLMIPQLMESISGGIVQVLFITTLLLLFSAYQDRWAMGTILYAFICIGLISTQFIQIIFFLPLLWITMFTNLQEGSLRTLVASLLGFILPYWFWGTYSLLNGTYDVLICHVTGITAFDPLFEGLVTPTLLVPIIFITLLGIAGIAHFLRYSYADSIKTRMFFNVLMLLFFSSIIFLVLQPQHSDFLVRIAIICVAPFVAHFFTFTNSWMTNILFYVALAVTLTLTILNTWIL